MDLRDGRFFDALTGDDFEGWGFRGLGLRGDENGGGGVFFGFFFNKGGGEGDFFWMVNLGGEFFGFE